MQLSLIALGVALIGFAVYHLVREYRHINNKKKIPGPTLLPFIGRIHDLPIDFMWLKFQEWAQQYSGENGFYMTEMLGSKFLVITDEKVAEELLIKRARYNSDRPVIRSLFDSKSTHGSGEYLPLMGKNKYWARQRKLTHGYLTEASNEHYYGVMYHESKRWMARLIENPDDFRFSLEDMASKVMCQLTWDDPSLSEYCTKSAWGLLTQMSPAGPLTNVLTPLWHLPLPLNPWKRAEYKRHDEQQAWWMERLLTTSDKMDRGQQRPCFTRKYLETGHNRSKLDGDHEASSVIGMMALVGIFTVAGPLSYWLVSMVHHPHWQASVQKEIDDNCKGRMPTLEDTPKLPILRACIKETMRWKPNVPTGVAHEMEADDVYRGYFLPKGTRILPLDWAFMRNAEKYPDPENFRPERWLDPGWPTYREPLTEYPTIKGMTSFGFGQRQCLGQTVTQDELIVACGALSWCFNLKPKQDPITGYDLPVPLDKSNSLLIIKPDPFQMAFEPRNEARKQEALRLWAVSDAQDQRERAAFAKGAEAEKLSDVYEAVDMSYVPEKEAVLVKANEIQKDEILCTSIGNVEVEVKVAVGA
ncbi:Uu.00g079250.m01.CDS01 [Anthostomella pinea]|uniref:Uu.00g079250.m01.CDS01 n=1 Tax=Anthostomella pinea TaxID=933095 RepID=A0AAI8VKS4_9PEZI|nr:Uu.00g079250.m01.CDS01 [Anthostomella pinea]